MNPCKLPMSFKCIKAFIHAFSGRFSRASLEGISLKFFVYFILNVSIGSAPKRKNFDIQRNTRVGSGGQFTSNRLSCHHIYVSKFLVFVFSVSSSFFSATFMILNCQSHTHTHPTQSPPPSPNITPICPYICDVLLILLFQLDNH